jgi:hypothetical protein
MEQLAKQAPTSKNSTVLVNDSVRTARKTEIAELFDINFVFMSWRFDAAARIESRHRGRHLDERTNEVGGHHATGGRDTDQEVARKQPTTCRGPGA